MAKILSRVTISNDISLKFQLKTLLAIADPYANASVVNAPAPNPGVATKYTSTISFLKFFFCLFLLLKILLSTLDHKKFSLPVVTQKF